MGDMGITLRAIAVVPSNAIATPLNPGKSVAAWTFSSARSFNSSPSMCFREQELPERWRCKMLLRLQ